ncbi:site-specific recombinase [Lonepinella sp. BR2474]|uniref:site-specific recombinase n=1 Tax=Lonepinella sp. BR2474 TaxID=3434548 RepID=UPI003F6DD687
MTIPFIQPRLDQLLADMQAQNDPFVLLQTFCQYLRDGGQCQANERVNLFIGLLQQYPDFASRLSSLLCRWLCQMRLYPLLVSSGILSRDGFGKEMKQRLYEKMNPAFKDSKDLRDVFFMLFHDRRDLAWLKAISVKTWVSLFATFQHYTEQADQNWLHQHLYHEGYSAIEMLAIWLAAEDLEPELMRLDPNLLDAHSPFVALQKEVAQWLTAQQQGEHYDDSHLQVMLSQCRKQIDRFHKRGVVAGSSLGVAHLLERLTQTLDRLVLLKGLFSRPTLSLLRLLQATEIFAEAATDQHNIAVLWKQSASMLSRTIAQNTSDHGEHYVTRSKKEYFAMFYSAAGGGILIALMALLKIYLGDVIEDKVWKSVAYGLNYGLGFMLIFMLHFTVATKQPAMTAARFAEAVERNPQGRAVNMKLAQLLIDVVRSQTIAVLGNVAFAMGLSALIAYFYAQQKGVALLDHAAIDYQLHAIDPTQGALWFAAIAGVWLFCSGIISGYFDNRSNYLNSKMRLRYHPVLKYLMPEKCRIGIANYLHDNYGSLMGNFCFGMLLGLTGLVGYWLGLPLDIRHVAFSSANLGYVAVSGDLSQPLIWQNLGFVLLIGMVNLLVSFTLALRVALKSLNTEIDSWCEIARCLCEIIRKRPLSFFLPLQLEK